MNAYDATSETERNARHNLTARLRALGQAATDQAEAIAAGHHPDMRQVSRRWLAVDEARAIHRACVEAVDKSVMRDAG